jgi:PD-(D/E)XK nuclease superfamily
MDAEDGVESEELPSSGNRTDDLLSQLRVDPAKFLDAKLPKTFLSHSQYGLYKTCGEAYRRKYVLGQRSGSSGRMAKGVGVHAGIEALLKGKMAGQVPALSQALAVLEDVFNSVAETVEAWEEGEDKSKLLDSGRNLLRLFTSHVMPTVKPLAVEKGFAKKIGDVPMVGWIDLIDSVPMIEVPNMPAEEMNNILLKPVVVDFKTTTKKWSDDQLAKNTQLTLYAHVEGIADVRVDQLIQSKTTAKLERGRALRTSRDAAVFEEDVNEVATLIKQGVFPKTTIDSWKCTQKHCEFFSQCRGKKG